MLYSIRTFIAHYLICPDQSFDGLNVHSTCRRPHLRTGLSVLDIPPCCKFQTVNVCVSLRSPRSTRIEPCLLIYKNIIKFKSVNWEHFMFSSIHHHFIIYVDNEIMPGLVGVTQRVGCRAILGQSNGEVTK